MRMQYPDQDSGPSPFPPQYAADLRLNLDYEWKSSPCDFPTPCPLSPSPISSSPASPSTPDSLISQFGPSTSSLDSEPYYISYTQQDTRMPKRRTSLQSILIPPFLSYPLSNASSEPPRSSTRTRSPSTSSHSSPCIPISAQALEATSCELSRISPPPDFLLDDDPFANHTGARPLPLHRSNPTSPTISRRTSVKQPRSPLAPEKCLAASPPQSFSLSECSRLPSSPPRLSPPSPPISGRQLRPAYTRPAFAPRPSLPSLHSLAQSDFVYPIKTRKGTLGARLPLEPWDVSAERESVLEEAPSFQGFDHATDDLEVDSSLGPEPSIGGNELIHTGDNYAHPTEAWPCKDPRALDGEASFLQPPIPFELEPEEGPNMFASLLGVLSSFSSASLSRSSSTSSSSSVPVLSPEDQTQWGDDSPSPSRSPYRSSSEDSASPDLSFEDDIVYPLSRTFKPDDWHSQSIDIDFLSIPGSFSTIDNFEPGTSAGTIRPLVNSIVSDGISTPDDGWLSNYGDYATPESDGADIFDEHLEDMGEAVDGNDRDNRTNGRDEGSGERQSSNGRGNGGQDWRQISGGGLHSNGHGSTGEDRRGGGSDDHGNDERDLGASSAFSTPSDTESEESEGEDTGNPTHHSPSDAPGDVPTSGDDDVPLAQSIPTALRAQRTIRKQVRDEKDERRRQRLLRRQQRQEQQRQQTPNQTLPDQESRHHTQVGPTPLLGPTQPPFSRSTRLRTKTLSSDASRPFPAEDLSRRLRDIQGLNTSPVPLLKSHSLSPPDSHPPSNQLGQRFGDHASVPKIGVQDKSIRPMRSFHRPSLVDATSEQPMPMPPLPRETHRIGRSATTASRPVKQRDPETSVRATSGSSSKSTRRPRTSDDTHQPSAAPLHPSVFQRIAIPRTPADVPGTTSIASAVPKETRQVSWQQRVFIVDLQRFNTLTMSPTTTAKEVIDALEAQGQLANWAGAGGWMLFEVSQDFGMERPIRHFETVSEVINSWDKNKSVNLLVAKKTPLANLLHPSAMPSSSPVFSTYVEWESKPRKWSKRWLELREQGLWLSKKDSGKDEIFLCSLANFDAYMVTRIHKSPKPYVFAVKSTDNLSFFENAADYVHVFCCSEKDGKKWLESVLLARSYFINQERNTVSLGVLPSSGGAPGKALSASVSRKGSRNVQQPLVNVSTLTATATPTPAYAFEPGSLLAKR